MPIRKKEAAKGVIDNLKPFRNHGFKQDTRAGNETQAIGNCIFCGKEGHFYINRETKQWDCKRCGKAGGFQIFLKEVVEHNKNHPHIEQYLKELSDDRGISVETLKAYDVGYNFNTGEYSVPIYFIHEGETQVYNIRRYQLGRKDFMNTAGCNNAVLNWDLANGYKKIWLCEGEWDGMAMSELLFKLERDETELAMAMPGAAMFKVEWLSLFQDKEVNVLYDADEAGRSGALKAYHMLQRSTSQIAFIHWGEVKEGYDIRDLYRDEALNAYTIINNQLSKYPEGVDLSAVNVKQRAHNYDGSGVPADEAYRCFTKWLYMPDTHVVDVVFGTMIANRQQSDPVWMFLVAPPGATKTSMLECLLDSPNVVYKNQLGAKSLVSGSMMAGGADPSLLPRLHERVLVIEDFTTVLSVPAAFRDEIFGILRAAYNGRYERDYGNGRIFRCDCEFGIVAGVTPAIEHHTADFAAVGERFLNYYLPVPKDVRGRKPFLKQARKNRGKEKEMKLELRTMSRQVLNYDFSYSPVLPDEYDDKILDLAQWTSMVRGTVTRERYSPSKEVTNEPYSELGTRLIKQYSGLVDGIGRFRRVKKIGIHEYNIIRKIAYDSAPNDRRKFLRAMWSEPDRGWNTGEISEITGFPRFPMCDRIAETLYMLGVIKKHKQIDGLRSSYTWHLDEDFAELTDTTGVLN
jgi:hypothetical protein